MTEGIPAARILVIDDEEQIRRFLRISLKSQGYHVLEAENAQQGLAMAATQSPDLVVLDLGLPDADGKTVLNELRAWSTVPVMILSVRASETEKVLLLDAGANDYVTKPFRLGVLLARLRAQLRQHEQSEDAVFTIGPYTFRPSAKVLIHGETQRKVRLTEKETSILKYLYRNGSKVVGRDILLNEVWGYNAGVTTHTLETHVYRLRQKIEADPSNAEILVTEPGGYRLIP